MATLLGKYIDNPARCIGCQKGYAVINILLSSLNGGFCYPCENAWKNSQFSNVYEQLATEFIKKQNEILAKFRETRK